MKYDSIHPKIRVPKQKQFKSKKRNVRRARPRRMKGMGSLGADPQVVKRAPNIPIQESMYTVFSCEADYKIPIATASITSGAVKLNSPWLPFRPGGSSAFGSYTFLGPATEATLMPTGYTTLLSSSLYNFYKVLRSTIEIRWSGSNSANNVIVTVIPTYNTTSFATIYTARAAPYARQCTFSVSKPSTGVGRDGFFRYSIDPYKIYGYNRPEAKADTLSASSGWNSDPGLTLWWQIFVQSSDLDVSSVTASSFQVRVRYHTQAFGLVQMPVT